MGGRGWQHPRVLPPGPGWEAGRALGCPRGLLEVVRKGGAGFCCVSCFCVVMGRRDAVMGWEKGGLRPLGCGVFLSHCYRGINLLWVVEGRRGEEEGFRAVFWGMQAENGNLNALCGSLGEMLSPRSCAGGKLGEERLSGRSSHLGIPLSHRAAPQCPHHLFFFLHETPSQQAEQSCPSPAWQRGARRTQPWVPKAPVATFAAPRVGG